VLGVEVLACKAGLDALPEPTGRALDLLQVLDRERGHFRYGAGVRSSMGHSHHEQEEAYVVVGGSGRMRLDEEIVELRR